MFMNGDRKGRFRHRQIETAEADIHIAEAGEAGNPAMLFLHGWPEDWTEFEQIMIPLSETYHVAAIDLPGIGASRRSSVSGDKRNIARAVREVIRALGLREPTLVGHDVGGQIVYAYLRAFPGELARAVIMNVAIPGVDPWGEVKKNPHIWHFAFHAVPDLPETLIAGREAAYFAYFYDAIAAHPGAVDEEARARYAAAYARPEALKTGLDWYRAFPQDERDNAVYREPVDTPVLYLRGDREYAPIEPYLEGLRAAGLRRVEGGLIPNSGHWSSEEQPDAVVAALCAFMASSGIA